MFTLLSYNEWFAGFLIGQWIWQFYAFKWTWIKFFYSIPLLISLNSRKVGVFAFYLPKRVGYYKFFSSFCQLYITSKPKIRTSWSRSLIRSWPNYVNWVHDWSLTVIWLLAFKVNVVLPDICPIRPHVQTVLLCVSVSIIYIHPIMRSKKAKALTIWTNSWILYTLTSYPIYPLICGWKKP